MLPLIIGIKQSREHVTNESLYHITDQAPPHERKLKFTGDCIRIPTDELAVGMRVVIY